MAAPPIPLDNLILSHGRRHMESQSSIVDDLLFEIYDRWQDGRHDSFESDTWTEYSSTSEVSHWRRNSIYSDTNHPGRLNQSALETQDIGQLRRMVSELQHRVNSVSSKLVRQLKRRERRMAKLQHNSDLVTAILQASSQKRRIDTRMRFSLDPPPGESAFDQWKDAMKAVARLPMGIPDSFRRKVWLSLADNHIKEMRIDWNKTLRFAFNERSNPDDNTLGIQIVKDLHRTGCSGFSGQDNDEDRAVLKRVLLGYARWNKAVGYCQGFNVIAALLLEVMDRKEEDALKVMIYLIDHVLPESYYANNLRALSVDMAVFRDLLRVTFPKLSKRLDYLQHAAQDQISGACYEPPLTNVFTMQWFLTLFATCLPKDIVLRVWDSILLEGSEILLRTALAIWGKLSRRIQSLSSADEFYSLMGILTQDMMDGKTFDADSLIKFIYNCAPFPMQQLPELREKYTYNIRPFTSAAGAGNRKSGLLGNMLPSDEDDLDEEDLEAITCFTGIIPGQVGSGRLRGADGETGASIADISMVGPGAYGLGSDSNIAANSSPVMERMSTDIASLKKQYHRLRQRQTQAHIIIAAASAKQQAKVKAIVPKIETPTAMNHLYVGKISSASNSNNKNRFVTASPRMVYPKAITVPHFLQEGKKTNHKSKEKESEKSERKTVRIENFKEKDTAAIYESSEPKSEDIVDEKEVSEEECSNKNSGLDKIEGEVTGSVEVVDIKEEKFSHQNKEPLKENRCEIDNEVNLHEITEKVEVGNMNNNSFALKPVEDIEEEVRSDSEDSGIIDNSEYQGGAEGVDDDLEAVYNRESDYGVTVSQCGEECGSDNNESESNSHESSEFSKNTPVAVSDTLQNDNPSGNDIESPENKAEVSFKCEENIMEKADSVQELHSALNSQPKDLEATGSESHNQNFPRDIQVNQLLSNKECDKPDVSVNLSQSTETSSESVKPLLKSCLKSRCQSSSSSVKSEGGNYRKMKLPKESLINLTEYEKSKRKISNYNQDSDSPKHLTDSDCSSLFSPNDVEASKKFSYNEKSNKQERTVSWAADCKLPPGLKPLGVKKPFDPFPVKHFNENRARTGIRLGIYTSSTFNDFEKQSKRRPLWSK